MQQHIADWERLDDAEKTYAWLRKTVKKVIKEKALTRNNRCWQSGEHHVRVDVRDRAGGRLPAKRTKGVCNNWLQKGRCSLANCPYDHSGPPASQRSGQSSRQSSHHSNRSSRGRSQSSRSHHSGRSGSRNSQRSSVSSRGRNSNQKKQHRQKGQRGRSSSFGRTHSKGPGSVSPHSNRSSQPTPKDPKWCTFYMKGFCKYGSRLCRYTHPGVCHRWKAGKCSNPCPQNLLHQERPKHNAAAVAQLHAAHANNVAKAQENKKQKMNKKRSSSRSSGKASSTSSRSSGKTKKKAKTKKDGSKKKTDGHKPKQSSPQ